MFLATSNPTLAYEGLDPMHGHAVIQARRVGETLPEDFQIPLGEYEGIVELAATVRASESDNTYASYTNAEPYQLKNVEAALRQQLETRGGIALAFVADYSAAFPSGNEEEFHKQAEEMLATIPCFRIEGATTTIGYHVVTSYRAIERECGRVTAAVQNQLGLEQPPKVAVILIYCHGLRTKLKIDYPSYNNPGSLRVDRVPGFVRGITRYATHDLTIALYACSAGRANKPNADSSDVFGRVHPCEERGGDSLGWTLYRELRRRGVAHPTVWAHTTAAHTTRNPYLRVFCSKGFADLPNLLTQTPRLQPSFMNAYTAVFRHGDYSAGTSAFIKHLRNSNMLREACTMSAYYLPWEWNGGTDATDKETGFRQQTHDAMREIYDRLVDLMPATAAIADELEYEQLSDEQAGTKNPRPRAHIIGLVQGYDSATLSQNFQYSEFEDYQWVDHLSVDLARKLQLLRYRFNGGLAPKRLKHNGEGVIVIPSSNTKTNRQRLLNKAVEMVNEGLIKSADLVNDQIHISRGVDLLAVVRFIHTEMMNNRVSDDANFIRENNDIDVWDLLSPIDSTKGLYDAFERWYQMVRNRGPWDYKGTIRQNHGEWAYDDSNGRAYGLDIWANLHYGYLGMDLGFSATVLSSAAGFAQWRAGTVPDGTWDRTLDEMGNFLAALDDPKDQEAIQIGIDLWTKYKEQVTVDLILNEVRARADSLNTKSY